MRVFPLAGAIAVLAAAACRPDAATAPDRAALYADVRALRLAAAPDSAPMSRATGIGVRYTVENALPRAVAVWGAPTCTLVVELRDAATGAIVFPTGAQNCTGPTTAFQLAPAGLARGTFRWMGPADASPVPAGTFQARLVVQGATAREAGDEVRVESAWSAPFTVAP